MIVEDEMAVALLLEDMLVELGCAVVGVAARVSKALDIIATCGPLDGAVLDVSLRGEKSYPVADELAARGIPFVLSTGYSIDGLAEPYKVYQILQKPYRKEELSRALSHALGASCIES